MTNIGGNQETFALAGADASFGSRTKDIFASLETIAAKHSAFESTPTARRESAALMKPDPSEDEIVSDKSDVTSFRVPACVPRKKFSSSQQRSVPGFKCNPSKWTAYDLSDVADGQMSERSNQSAALEFLQMRRTGGVSEPLLEENSPDSSSESTGCAKHMFRKPVRVVASTDDDSAKGDSGKIQRVCSKRVRTVAEELVGETDEEQNSDIVLCNKDVEDSVYEPRQKIDLSFSRAKRAALRVPRVRGRKQSQSDSDSENGDETDQRLNEGDASRVNIGNAMVADSNSDDDFSELAAIGPDSEDEHSSDNDCYVSDMGVVSATNRARFSAEHEDSNGGLDCID